MRRGLVIAGMHRSGTSVIARLLGLLGAELPKNLVPPVPGNNELGFWEPSTIVQVHDELLISAGSAWDDVSPMPASWFESELARAFEDRLVQLVGEEYGEAPLFVLKDPRMCRLLRLWKSVMRRVDAEVAVIITVRNPLEVTASLKARDGFPPAKSLLLWLRHFLDAERDSRGDRRSFISYADLLRDWRPTVDKITAELGVSWPRLSHRAGNDIETFLSEAHRHHVFDLSEVEAREDIVDWVKAVYHSATDLAAGGELSPEVFDEVAAELAKADLAYGPLVAELSERTREVDELRGSTAAREHELGPLRAELSASRDALAARKEEVGRVSAQLQMREKDISAQSAERQRVVAELSVLKDELRALREELAEHDRSQAAIEEALRSRRWLELRPRRGARAGIKRSRTPSTPSVSQFGSWILRPSPTRLRFARTFLALRRCGEFDADFYLSRNSDVARARVNPLMHYVQHGAFEGRDPNARFSTRGYLDRHPEVAAAGINPLLHFLRHGRRDPRQVSSLATNRDRNGTESEAPRERSRGHAHVKPPSQIGSRLIADATRRVTAASPSISVIVPTHNRRETLEQALTSILTQSYLPTEILVSDDGSTDGSEEMVRRRFASELAEGRLRYVKGPHTGVSAARNRALREARGDLIAYLDSDNAWEADYLLLMADCFVDHPDCNTAYCGLSVLGSDSRADFVRGTPYDRALLLAGNFIDLNIFMHRRRLIPQLGGFDENLRRLVDWDLILRYTRLNPPRFLPATLGRYYRDRAPDTITKLENLEENRTAVLQRHEEERRWLGLQPLRLAYVLWDYPALSQTFALNELRWLVEAGYDVRVYYREVPDRAVSVDSRVRSFRVENEQDLARLLVEHERTLVHAHFAYPATALLVYPAVRSAHVPFTFTPHAVDLFHHRNVERNRIGEISQHALCRRIFAISQFHRSYLRERGVPREKISLSRVAVRYDAAPDAELDVRLGRTRRVVITIARFIEKKGITDLIAAAGSLEPRGVEFRIYGYGPLEDEYRTQIAEQSISNVKICGALDDYDAVRRAYAEADVFVLPCVRASDGDMDGLPTVLMEAMAHGVPVVTTRLSGIPDLVADGVSGLLVPPGDVPALASGITRVLDMSAGELRRLLRNARDIVERTVGVERTMQSLRDVWQSPPIEIVLVTYNSPEIDNRRDTEEIVKRLFEHTTTPFTMTIVDNASERSFTDWLDSIAAEHSNVRLLKLDRNVLWAPAVNIALEQSTGEFVFYVCSKEGFIAKPGWEQDCLRYMRDNPRVALAGHLISSPTFSDGASYQRQAWFDTFRNKEFANTHVNRDFHHVQGGLFVLRRAAYEECGGLNPDVPQGGADIEYSYFLESSGWSLGSIPNLYSLTTKTRPTLQAFIDEKTMAAHPLSASTVADLDRVVEGQGRKCNVCGWLGAEFRHQVNGAEICPECGATNFSRSVYRYLAESNVIYRDRECLAILPDEALRPKLGKMFRLKELITSSDALSVIGALEAASADPGDVVIAKDASLTRGDTERFTAGVFRCLRPGGLALLSVQDRASSRSEGRSSVEDENRNGNGTAGDVLASALASVGFDVEPILYTSDVVRFEHCDLFACRRPS